MTTTGITDTTISRFLSLIEGGKGGEVAPLYAGDAVLDATVPDWRFSRRGAAAIAGQYAGWFADPGRFEELRRRPTPTGEVVTYLLTWLEAGVPFAAHHCHVLELDPATGLITSDVVFCGGRWNAARMAEMEEAERRG